MLADLFQRAGLATVEAEAELEDLPLALVERGQQVRIFKLDPLPAPSDRKPIPLGYVSDG